MTALEGSEAIGDSLKEMEGTIGEVVDGACTRFKGLVQASGYNRVTVGKGD